MAIGCRHLDCARALSEDDGRTWGREIILRDDGGSWDLGYPRVIEHEAGRLLCRLLHEPPG